MNLFLHNQNAKVYWLLITIIVMGYSDLKAQADNDSIFVKSVINKATVLIDQAHYDSAKHQLVEVLELMKMSNYPYGKAKTALLLSKIYRLTENYEDGLKYGILAIDQFTILNLTSELSDAYDQVGFIYEQKETYQKAITNFKESITLKQKLGEKKQVVLLQEHIAMAYETTQDYPQAYDYYKVLLDQYQGNSPKRLSLLYKTLSLANRLEKWEDCRILNQQLFDLYATENNQEGLAIALNNLGFLERKAKNVKAADVYFKQSLDLISTENIILTADYIPLMINTSVAAANLNSLSKGKKILSQAFELAEQYDDTYQMANIYNHLGGNYYLSENISSAKEVVNAAIDIAKKDKHLDILEESYYLLALLGEAENKPEIAEKYLNLSKEVKEKRLQQNATAQQELLQQEIEADKREDRIRTIIASKAQQERALREFALNAERQQQALDLKEKEVALLKSAQELQKATIINQQLEQERIKQQLALAREATRNAEHQQEIALLQKDRELQELERNKKEKEVALLNAQRRIDQETIKQQNYLVVGISFVSVLFLLLVIVFIWAFLMKRKSNKAIIAKNVIIEKNNEQLHEQSSGLKLQAREIQAQNEELQQQNEEIHAQKEHIEQQNKYILEKQNLINQSISAAELIQQSILPSHQEMSQALDDHFVIYRPKDIVSGDFYWVTEVDNYTFLSTVDCTGHGVPGAFMSMIGHALLNEIVKLRKVHDPAQILECLHNEVNNTLRQETGEINIGMDLSLIRIEKRSDKSVNIAFSGAKRPLLYTRPNGADIQKLVPTRRSIGGRSYKKQPKPFETINLYLPKGSMIYMFSDGFADQNGGHLGKKIGSARLHQLLELASSKSMNRQKTMLEDILEKHKGFLEQRDDVLLLGMRVA